jgi:hypothetical protein
MWFKGIPHLNHVLIGDYHKGDSLHFPTNFKVLFSGSFSIAMYSFRWISWCSAVLQKQGHGNPKSILLSRHSPKNECLKHKVTKFILLKMKRNKTKNEIHFK